LINFWLDIVAPRQWEYPHPIVWHAVETGRVIAGLRQNAPTSEVGESCMTRIGVLLALWCAASAAAAQAQAERSSTEEIFILRSVHLSRIPPTAFCGPDRTGNESPLNEGEYEFRAVETDASSGAVISASGPTVGRLQGCFGATPDPHVLSFYAEATVHGISWIGRGECQKTQSDFPEAGFALYVCHLGIAGLPDPYVGGQLSTNTVISRLPFGIRSDPPGYTQPSIASVRLWKRL
jgi:hypothetical protein